MVKKNYIGIMFLISLLFIISPLVLAIQTMPTQKQYSCVSIPQVCSTCTYVNLSSIKLPNSEVALINSPMEKNGVNYNYTFCNTTQLGTYIVTTCGDKDSVFQCATYDFNVTTTGNDTNNTIPLFLGLGGFIMFIIAILTRNLYIGFISGTFFIVLGVYLMIFGLGNMSDFYTQSLSYFAIGFGLLIMLSAGYEAIADTGTTLWKKGGKDDEEDF